ncbi:hypothetical protein [Aphanothece microscopica]|uniref:hypothetical protein n=1 Tax=Aphanothece microscopica TaxID=1049561 RepID=UPI003CE5C2B8
MVGLVLSGNGITRYGDGRDAPLQLCRQRLDGFREQRGEELARSSPGTSSEPVISGNSRPLPV